MCCALHVLFWFYFCLSQNFFGFIFVCLRTLTTLFCKQWGQGPKSSASPDSIVQPNMILVIFFHDLNFVYILYMVLCNKLIWIAVIKIVVWVWHLMTLKVVTWHFKMALFIIIICNTLYYEFSDKALNPHTFIAEARRGSQKPEGVQPPDKSSRIATTSALHPAETQQLPGATDRH